MRLTGAAHTIAYLCFRDNIVRYAGEMTAEDMAHMSSMERLSRTENSTLIGLMVKAPIDYTMLAPPVLQNYITRTDELLAELHQVVTTRTAIRGRHSYTGHDPCAAPNCKFDPAVTAA